MRLGGRVQAAAEVLADIDRRKRPAGAALKDWGTAHRFAGSGDRAAIGNLIYDTLRQKLSQAAAAGSDEPQALVFATLARQWKMTGEEIAAAMQGDKFAPDVPEIEWMDRVAKADLADAPAHVRADIPQWCEASFEANFADEWVNEARALSRRPPLDLRVNTAKANRDKVAKHLARDGAKPTAIARHGLRIAPGERAARLPNVQASAGYQKGWFEIQDEGSQIVADLVYASPGDKVLDYCAGGGGKTLALSAAMENRGQVHAHDASRERLAPIHARLTRAGTRNVQVHEPGADLSALEGKMDRVVVDAPCSGSGAWRRRPDTKWRIEPANLETRLAEQGEALSQAGVYVRPGGFLIYITCSVLPEENENQVYGFLEDHSGFELVSAGEVWQDLFGFDKPQPWSSDMKSVTLTPASTGTDGFFFAAIGRKSR